MKRRNKLLLVVVCFTIVTLGGGRMSGQATVVPSPWSSRDIGSPAIAGATSFDQTSGTFSIDAAGQDIWGTADQFHFVYQPIAGDAMITARVDALSTANSWSKAGVMIRSSLTANAAHAYALVSAASGAAFQRRRSVGGASVHTAGATTAVAPLWVRLVRSGSTVTASVSSNGTSWTTIGFDTIALSATAYVGLAVTSHNVSQLTSAAVSSVSATRTGALPSPQQSQDIGSPSIAGSATHSQGTYTVTTASRNVGGTADQFHFVYQPMTADMDVRVRVASLAGVPARAKAGVMIREKLTSGSAHAFAALSRDSGFLFQRRPTAGGTSVSTAVAGATPGWVRLIRTGDLITAYRSIDGTAWTTIGSDSFPMAETVYVGIAVTSRDVSAATTATLTNLIINQSVAPNQPPAVTLSAPVTGATYAAPATIDVTAAASDADGTVARVDFYNGSTLLASDTTAPYAITWSNVAAGTYALKATAVDNAGASGSSPVASVTVTAANQPPTVTLTAPANSATFTAPATIALAANASDPENQLTRVEFYSGTALLGTDTAAPYSFTWSAVPAGTYALRAVAYDAGGLSGTTAASVSVTVDATSALPPGQQAVDIGGPAIGGSTTYNSGSYQIHAGGADIWNTADQFHYVYQQMSGDIDVSARIVSQSFSDEWAKAGVMIRVALDAASPNVATTVSAGRSYAFQRRAASGAATVATNVAAGPPPGWVRLTRTGALVTAYRSTDGQNWTVIGTDSIPMPDSVYVGIAVTSHNTAVATDAVADNFRATASAPVNQPPAVSLTAPANGVTYTAPASITMTATASDADGSVARVDFYNGTTLLGSDSTAPYAFTWSPVPAGTYVLKGTAVDDAGATGSSATATITVSAALPPPTAVGFQASPDHEITTSYRLEIFANGADPSTATPLASSDLGKPTPDASGDIVVNRATLFSGLAPGTYVLTVSSIGVEATSRSAPVTFTR